MVGIGGIGGRADAAPGVAGAGDGAHPETPACDGS